MLKDTETIKKYTSFEKVQNFLSEKDTKNYISLSKVKNIYIDRMHYKLHVNLEKLVPSCKMSFLLRHWP